MHRIDGPGHVNNQFSKGNPAAGGNATEVTVAWLNALQEEICNVITAAGITLDKANNGQLLQAILALGGGVALEGSNLLRVQPTAPPDLPVGGIWVDTSGTVYLPPSIGELANRAVLLNTALANIAVTIDDPQDVNACVLSCVSSNSAVVPADAITFGGAGANRTMSIAPLATVGSSLITVTVTNPETGLNASDSFSLAVAATMFAITASAGANGAISPAGAVSAAQGGDVTFTAQPAAGYRVDTLTVDGTPYANLASYTFVDVQANHTISVTFAVNQAPTISNIADQSVAFQTPTGAIAFTVGDTETPAADLVVTATSSNQPLVPNGGIVLGGSGANRTITCTPANGQAGQATITVNVSDGSAVTSDTFVLSVLPQTPAISSVVGSSGAVTVNWTDVGGETSYNVYYSTSNALTAATKDGANPYPGAPDATAGMFTGLAAGTVQKVIGGLTNGTTYYVRVEAVAAGVASISTVVSGVPSIPLTESTYLDTSATYDSASMMAATPNSTAKRGSVAVKPAVGIAVTRIDVAALTDTDSAWHNAANTIRCRICADDGTGKPNESSVIATVNATPQCPATNGTAFTLSAIFATSADNYASRVALTAGTRYHVVFDLVSPTGLVYTTMRIKTGSSTTDELAYTYFSGSAWQAINEGYNPAVKIYRAS